MTVMSNVLDGMGFGWEFGVLSQNLDLLEAFSWAVMGKLVTIIHLS